MISSDEDDDGNDNGKSDDWQHTIISPSFSSPLPLPTFLMFAQGLHNLHVNYSQLENNWLNIIYSIK